MRDDGELIAEVLRPEGLVEELPARGHDLGQTELRVAGSGKAEVDPAELEVRLRVDGREDVGEGESLVELQVLRVCEPFADAVVDVREDLADVVEKVLGQSDALSDSQQRGELQGGSGELLLAESPEIPGPRLRRLGGGSLEPLE